MRAKFPLAFFLLCCYFVPTRSALTTIFRQKFSSDFPISLIKLLKNIEQFTMQVDCFSSQNNLLFEISSSISGELEGKRLQAEKIFFRDHQELITELEKIDLKLIHFAEHFAQIGRFNNFLNKNELTLNCKVLFELACNVLLLQTFSFDSSGMMQGNANSINDLKLKISDFADFLSFKDSNFLLRVFFRLKDATQDLLEKSKTKNNLLRLFKFEQTFLKLCGIQIK